MNKATTATLLLVIGGLLCAAGCSQVSGAVQPGVNLAPVRSYYVVRDKQSDATDAVQKELARRGFVATTGPEASMPAGVDCKVLVRDHWMWDMTMYLKDLEVDFVHPRTGAPLASAKSYRPSLQRKPVEEMAREVMDKIYGTEAPE